MALQLILGRSGAGKSYALQKKVVEQSMKNPKQSYFFVVPEQFTLQTESELLNLHPRHGISNIDVVSFMRLAYRVFAEQGGMSQTVLEDTGKSMLVRRVLSEKKEELQLFHKYAKKPGYISEIKSLLSEFYQYDVQEDTMERMLSLTEDKPLLRRKLQDMQVICQGFEEQLEGRYITTEEILDVLAEQVEQSQLLQGTVVALDGFTGFTPVQYKLLRRLLRVCKDVLVTVTIDPEESPALQKEEFSLFHLSREMIDKLYQIANEEGVSIAKDYRIVEQIPRRFQKSAYLACLEHNLYRFTTLPYEQYCREFGMSAEGEDFVLYGAKNMQGEVDFVVREIFRLVKEEGYRYRDIAIVTGDLENFSRLVSQSCAREQIPCFVDYKKDIMGNPLVDLLRTVLQLFIRNFDYENVFRYLRCGLVDMDMEIVDKLENYVLATGVKGFSRWNKPWKRWKRQKLTDEEKASLLEEYNEYRQMVIGQFTNIQKVFGKNGRTVSEYTFALHDFLVEHDIFHRLQAYEKQFEEQDMPLLAKEYSQVYQLVLGIFDKLVQLLGEEQVTLQEYSELLETGFGEVKVGLLPPGVDQILVGDIERTRLTKVKALFFIGVNEGIVPKSGAKGGILSDMERELMAEHQIVLAPTARQTVYTQQYYFYMNLTKPERKLYLTYHKVNQEGKPALPSSLIRTLTKIFPEVAIREEDTISPMERVTEEQMEELLSASFGKRYLLEGLQMVGTTELADWWKELYRFYMQQDVWKKRITRLAEGVGFVNEENPLSRQVAEALYGKELNNSVTRIEKYAACAYAHFLQYGLELREREEFQFGGVDFGNIFHQVLSIFPAVLKKKGGSWRESTVEQVSEAVEECLQLVAENYGNAILFSSQQNIYQVERISRILKRTIWALAEQLKAGQFDPEGYEIYFRNIDGLESTRMDLGDERMLRLNGQIDRLDVCQEEDAVYVKVIDYKTGKMAFDITNLYYGLQMQLVVYMNAALEEKQQKYPEKKIRTAGIFYYNIDDPFVERADLEEEIDRALLKELKMNGLVNRDDHVITLLDQAFGTEGGLAPNVKSLAIPVETLRDGGLSKRSKVVSEEQFVLLGKYAREKMIQEGREILEGNISIAPYKKDKRTACDYCAYRSVCNFDTRLPGNQYRDLRKLEEDQVWTAMEELVKKNDGAGRMETKQAGKDKDKNKTERED